MLTRRSPRIGSRWSRPRGIDARLHDGRGRLRYSAAEGGVQPTATEARGKLLSENCSDPFSPDGPGETDDARSAGRRVALMNASRLGAQLCDGVLAFVIQIVLSGFALPCPSAAAASPSTCSPAASAMRTTCMVRIIPPSYGGFQLATREGFGAMILTARGRYRILMPN